MDQHPTLGIDIGSVSISAVLLDPSGEVRARSYRFHKGKVREGLEEAIRDLGPGVVAGIGLTAGSPRLLRHAREIDRQVCLITACRRLFDRVGAILYVGGERFGLIRFDESGAYAGTRSNSSCAAGTGSFLDQQARRLGLSSSAELAAAALRSAGEPPRISTRCAVFARTDLVHAQQAGYSREEICDGLASGMARNIADTLLLGEKLLPPVIFAGGVAANEAVRRHVEALFGVPVLSHELSPLLGAVGAALAAAEDAVAADDRREPVDLRGGAAALLEEARAGRQYFFEPLSPERSRHPAPAGTRRSRHESGRYTSAHPVEVEVYRDPAEAASGGRVETWLGIDVGSTSTKAMLTDASCRPLVGLYTRTLGSPVSAAQALLEALAALEASSGALLDFAGLSTTGAGRAFVGRILGADLVVDEITAHARAAVELVPDVDTIIEIGGQDAKFTTLRDGRVTFAHMNTVCAAGTGSFIEEQALRLGCDLADYAARVDGVRAPLASDRCAVFMERDINDLLSRGFSTEEILASCLFAVRENYLQKVARGAAIGERVCFQGATARNPALVAAFEQGLGKPIYVSPYCHLTGALGAALLAREQRLATASPRPSSFRGLEAMLRQEIPIRGETCGLCTNHCRLRIAEVEGETLAWGFLCGRDYDTRRYVSSNRSGFDLFAERRKAFAEEQSEPEPRRSSTVIGIPAALSLYEELPLWKRFFEELRIPVITSEGLGSSVSLGKNLEGAEFCAPLAALHGHAAHLASRADFVFLPVHLDERGDASRASRSYCYYTQFASALASAVEGVRGKALMPVASFSSRREQSVRELHRALEGAGIEVDAEEVASALERAAGLAERAGARLRRRFLEEMATASGPSVVLVGRPYTILSPEMNKGIPGIFASLGVKVFTQDMVSWEREDVEEIEPLLRAFHWHYAARILEVATVAAKTPLLYPVYVTSFKCSPDSFAVEYFKRILDERGKPYLVLQLDDHDSSMGYETRIEAGVRAFRNHASAASRPRLVRASATVPRVDSKLDGRTLLLPPWDNLVIPLIAAALRREGIDARVLEEDPLEIRKAMRHNTGQCIPLNVIAEEAMDYVGKHGLEPARTALWMPRGGLACNFPLFPPFIKTLFDSRGGGMERLGVFTCDITLVELGFRVSLRAYRAALVGGLLRRVGCRIRPYEVERGSTDRALRKALEIMSAAFEKGPSVREAAREAAALFDRVATVPGRRPKVAIFGDLYVRDNDVMSQELIHAIEDAGGEVVSTSLVEYWRIVIGSYYRKWLASRDYGYLLVTRAVWTMMERTGRPYAEPFERFLGPWHSDDRGVEEWILEEFGVRSEHAGESFDNLLKIHHIWREHPDLRLFVQANPAFCCPSLVTEAMARDIRRATGVPVVSLTYDGTGGYRNDAIVPYLRYARELESARPAEAGAGAARR